MNLVPPPSIPQLYRAHQKNNVAECLVEDKTKGMLSFAHSPFSDERFLINLQTYVYTFEHAYTHTCTYTHIHSNKVYIYIQVSKIFLLCNCIEARATMAWCPKAKRSAPNPNRLVRPCHLARKMKQLGLKQSLPRVAFAAEDICPSGGKPLCWASDVTV